MRCCKRGVCSCFNGHSYVICVHIFAYSTKACSAWSLDVLSIASATIATSSNTHRHPCPCIFSGKSLVYIEQDSGNISHRNSISIYKYCKGGCLHVCPAKMFARLGRKSMCGFLQHFENTFQSRICCASGPVSHRATSKCSNASLAA